MGEWAAAFGRQESVHSGTFMGIERTGKKIEIRYTELLKLKNGKSVGNLVMVELPHVVAQLGHV